MDGRCRARPAPRGRLCRPAPSPPRRGLPGPSLTDEERRGGDAVVRTLAVLAAVLLLSGCTGVTPSTPVQPRPTASATAPTPRPTASADVPTPRPTSSVDVPTVSASI